jgi:hypothetical protein
MMFSGPPLSLSGAEHRGCSASGAISMQKLQQQLRWVHDELTHLMAEAKLDSLSRSKLAFASNRVLDIIQQIHAEATKQAQAQCDPHARHSIVKSAMAFLAWWGNLLKDIIMIQGDEDGS